MNTVAINKFTASLHTHVRSLYDAHIDAKALCERISMMEGKGCAITDHGVLSSIEDYRAVFKDYGLKMIPGCELYVDGGILGRLHLVVLAKNDNGYKGICKIVTQSNRTMQGEYPVISQDDLFSIMRDYKGDIFALSACMQGVISAIFLQNNTVEKKIEKIRKKQEKYTDPTSNEMVDIREKVEKATLHVDEMIQKRDETKALSEMKFIQREKAISKKESQGEDVKELLLELETDKEKANKAKEVLPDVKKELDDAKKSLSAYIKEEKELLASVDKFLALEEEIIKLKKELKSAEELYALAKETANKYLNVFGKGRFLAEVQYHGIEEEAICFPKVVDIAKDLGLPLVATNDVHILTNSDDDRLRRQILRSLRFGEVFEEENVGASELFLKDNYELKDALSKIISEDDAIRAIKNIDVVFDACNVEFVTGKHYPKFKE
jgi:DNA polymerase-3 subunit alpha